MKNKKHIDELFTDSFQDFEATPSPEVWDNIQRQMAQKKKNRKVIPLWWKLGGVAALLALLLTVGNSVFNSHTTDEPALSSEDTPESFETTTQPEKSLQEDPIYNTTVTTEDPTGKEESNVENVSTTGTERNSSLQKRRVLQTDASQGIAVEKSIPSTSIQNQAQSQKTKESSLSRSKTSEAVAVTSEVKKERLNTIDASQEVSTSKIASEATEKNRIEKNQTNKDPIGKSEKNKISPTETVAVAATEVTEKRSLLEEIESNQQETVIVSDEEPVQRWAVSPQIAPVYYNSLNGGSSIDPMFADNSQSGDVNVSYGIQVSYQINKRLSIRSGVNNVNVGYTTGGLELANSPESAALSAVDYNTMGRVLTAFDKGTVSNISPFDENFGQITPKAGGNNAEMNQQIQYYEVPLELKYALLDRKVGIHFIGGLSTLLLGNNEVSVQSGSVDEVIGEANNLSDVSFSTNVGLGFDYKLSKNFTFNLEPMFKYQLNTYTNSSVDFRPYTLGVYTGLSFRF